MRRWSGRRRLRPVGAAVAGFLTVAALLGGGIALGGGPGASAAGRSFPGRILVVTANNLPWQALEKGRLPVLEALAARGSAGMMNSNVGGRRQPGAGYLSLGAGTRAAGTPSAEQAYEAEERAGAERAAQVYWRHVGLSPPSGALVHPGWGELLQANAALPFPVEAGALGEALRLAGIPLAVVGNADLPGRVRRPAVALAADRHGVVPGGALGGRLTIPDLAFPGGVRTDLAALVRAAGQALADHRVVVVDLGDTARLETERTWLTAQRAPDLEDLVYASVDQAIGRLAVLISPDRDLLLFVVPEPSSGDLTRGDSLTFVAAVGNGFPRGVLTSPSTRRPGLVTSADFAPTVLARLGVSSQEAFLGRPVTGVATPGGGNALAWVLARHRALTRVQSLRAPLLKTYTAAEIIILMALLVTYLQWRPCVGLLLPPVLALAMVPLVFLFWPGWLVSLSPALLWLASMVAAGTVLWVNVWRGNPLGAVVAVAWVTMVSLFVDTLTGANLQSVSPLGYSAIGGARYYGMGNEYMGVFLGSVVVAGASLLKRAWGWGSWTAAAVFVGAVVLLASPGLGANFGGALAAAVAFGLTWLAGLRPRLDPVAAVLAFAIPVALILFLTLADGGRDPTVQSHIGRAFATAHRTELLPLVQRKLALNLRLIRYTAWSWVFLFSLGTYLLALLRPGPRSGDETDQFSRSALAGTAAASVAALIFNDSGIVAAATGLVYAPAVLLALDKGGETPAGVPGARANDRRVEQETPRGG